MEDETLSISGIRLDDWVNPFGATPEELLAGTLEEGGLLNQDTVINGRSAHEFFQAYNNKRRQFQEATRLGSMLIKTGALTQEQLSTALFYQKEGNLPLGEVLLQLGYCSEKTIETILSRQQTIRNEMEEIDKAHEQRRGLWRKIAYFFQDHPDKP